MCQQDVCPATLYTRTTDPRPHKSEAQQPPSSPPVRAGTEGKSGEMPANHTHPTPLPSQQALLCPRPWAVGVGRTARTTGGGGHKGQTCLIVAPQNPPRMEARSRFSRSARKVTGGVDSCRRGARWWLVVAGDL